MEDQNKEKPEKSTVIKDAAVEVTLEAAIDDLIELKDSIPKSFYSMAGDYLIKGFHQVVDILETLADNPED